jgi:hypothetical protein
LTFAQGEDDDQKREEEIRPKDRGGVSNGYPWFFFNVI